MTNGQGGKWNKMEERGREREREVKLVLGETERALVV